MTQQEQKSKLKNNKKQGSNLKRELKAKEEKRKEASKARKTLCDQSQTIADYFKKIFLKSSDLIVTVVSDKMN
jgi:hypothetical protein